METSSQGSSPQKHKSQFEILWKVSGNKKITVDMSQRWSREFGGFPRGININWISEM